MLREWYRPICAVLILLCMLGACANPGDPADTSDDPTDTTGPFFAVRGRLGSGYQPVGRAVRALDDSVIVDQIMAVPVSLPFMANPTMFEGAVTASVAEDGSFELSLDKGTDYVIALVNSAADRRDQIAGYVALADLSDSMVLLPGSGATGDVEAGDVAEHGSEAYADGSLVDNAESFSLTLEQLREIARTDDILKTLKNLYTNGAVPLFVYWWRVDVATARNTQTQPAAYAYDGYQLYLPVPGVDATPDDVVNKSVIVEIVPPGEVRSVDGLLVRGPEAPFTNDGEFRMGEGWAADDDLGVDTDVVADCLRVGTVGGNIETILEGFWEIRLDGVVVASYDLSVASPFRADANPVVYLPGVKAVVDDETGILDQVELAWYQYDSASAQFLQIQDLTVMAKAIDNVLVCFDGQTFNGEFIGDAGLLTAPTIVPVSTWYFAGTEGPPPEQLLRGIRVSYRMYGVDFAVAAEVVPQ